MEKAIKTNNQKTEQCGSCCAPSLLEGTRGQWKWKWGSSKMTCTAYYKLTLWICIPVTQDRAALYQLYIHVHVCTWHISVVLGSFRQSTYTVTCVHVTTCIHVCTCMYMYMYMYTSISHTCTRPYYTQLWQSTCVLPTHIELGLVDGTLPFQRGLPVPHLLQLPLSVLQGLAEILWATGLWGYCRDNHWARRYMYVQREGISPGFWTLKVLNG